MEAICISSKSTQLGRHLPNYSRPRRPPALALPAAARCQSRANRMFVFGMGFVGRYVADRLKQEGWEVSGTCRSVNNKGELEEMGLDAFIFDVHKNELKSLPTLQDATHVLVSIPPIAGFGDPLLCLHDLQSTLNYGNLQWMCYLSSTSSYPVNPEKSSSRSRFEAEKGWQELGRDIGVPVNIFRLGGIYGPGRSALDTIMKQKSMSREQKTRESKLYTARVHVADIYQAVKASFDAPAPSFSFGRIYNVVDDDPSPRAEVFAYAKTLIDSRWPSLVSETPSSDDVTDLHTAGEKRVSNARLKEELGVSLLFPDYRSGLRSIFHSWKISYF